MNSLAKISVVIVTHGSGAVIGQCLAALEASTLPPHEVIVVDSRSPDPHYLDAVQRRHPDIKVLRLDDNVGFSRANNIGFRHADPSSDFILFLNPDAFVVPTVLAALACRMQDPAWSDVGVCTPLLAGYQLETQAASGRVDSAGIGQTWYGRFFDRGQGELNHGQFGAEQESVAICGAFMFCRRAALLATQRKGQVFDETFFMYKEDIELSLRIAAGRWRLMYCGDLTAYHCRGWNTQRALVPTWAIKRSLRNDWAVWWAGYGSGGKRLITLVYLCLKSVLVGVDVWLVRRR